jgi:tRNA (cmo5U34)-methyltransferase
MPRTPDQPPRLRPHVDPPAPEPERALWSEENSSDFLAFGGIFVPDREEQIATVVRLIPACEERHIVLDLGCGDGLLAEAILGSRPPAIVLGFDQSETMLRAARARLARFGERFVTETLLLEDLHRWEPALPPLCAVSSLAIHHLDSAQKQALFRRIFQLLLPGGAVVIADLMAPGSLQARQLAADAWDDSVRDRSIAISGSLQAYEFFIREHWNAHRYLEPDDIDKPSRLIDQLHWLEEAGFVDVDVHWMRAGHAIFGGGKPPMPAP